MAEAFKVYRLGGDEFVIIYFNKSMEIVEREVNLARERCSQIQLDTKVPVGVSFGDAEREKGEEFSSTINRADAMMYSEKNRFYR